MAKGVTQFVQCLCGAVGGLTGWTVVRQEKSPNGKVELAPSINMVGHFHTPNPTGLIPTGRIQWEP